MRGFYHGGSFSIIIILGQLVPSVKAKGGVAVIKLCYCCNVRLTVLHRDCKAIV